MYHYDNFDAAFVAARVEQFRDQVARRLSGELTEEQFRPHRLMNGLYLQLHSYMLRVAVPYGDAELAPDAQARRDRAPLRSRLWPFHHAAEHPVQLAGAQGHARHPRRTRQRRDARDPDLGQLHPQRHRRPFRRRRADEIADPRPYAEILRQWSSLHPEFSFLPRKFKIAVNGATHDRAVIQAHDIGLQVVRNEAGEIGFTVYVGGGLGRTPIIGRKIRDFLPERDLLAYVEAILRVYNLEGRRDNKFKARIKILLHEKGLEALREAVEAEFAAREPRRARPAAAGHRARSRLLRSARAGAEEAGQRPRRAPQGQGRAFRQFLRLQRRRRTKRRATPSSRCR